ncbi:hypothetical protein GE061_011033 [Apolygus lucorum]|uniref:Uncharacterized protein n=1 Tax=Apolygus lucorum TaxID=248454 RepID=A0A8S9XXI1_APOLU|nr:hypothetical protein GE061_011033 [Apolygus lucorum]
MFVLVHDLNEEWLFEVCKKNGLGIDAVVAYSSEGACPEYRSSWPITPTYLVRNLETSQEYGRVQSVKLLGRSGGGGGKEEEGAGACATVSFMDIKSAAKAHHSEQKLDERTLTTEYHEPAAIPCPGTLYSGSGPPNPQGASTGSRFSSHG